MLAAMYSHSAPPNGLVTGSYGAITRLTRSSAPWSNSWLPAAETSRPASFSASIVGLSFWMNDSNVEAPIRSPAAANTVLGFSARSSFTAPAIAPAPAAAESGSFAIRPWKSFVPRIWMSVVPDASGALIPMTSGLWSEAENGTVPSNRSVPT